MTDVLGYERGRPGEDPPYLDPNYGSTVKRAPSKPLVRLEHTLTEVTGPGFADGWTGADKTDLTRQSKAQPIGERMIVAGRMLDEHGRPIPRHIGGALAGQFGGALPARWRSARRAARSPLYWAPAMSSPTTAASISSSPSCPAPIPGGTPTTPGARSICTSRCSAPPLPPASSPRCIFPAIPLLEYDPIFHSIPDEAARNRLISRYDPSLSVAEWALGYRFDIVLRGRLQTPTGI